MIARLARFARPYVGLLVGALGCAVLFAAGRMARMVLIKPVLDDVLPAAADQQLDLGWPGAAALASAAGSFFEAGGAGDLAAGELFWLLMLAGLLIALALPAASFGKDYLVESAMGRVLIDLQQALCTKLLALSLSFHQDLRRGDAMTRILNDALRAHAGLRIFFADVAQDGIAVAVGLATLLTLSWQLSITVLLVVPPIAWIVASFGRKIQRTAQRRQETAGDLTQRLVEILSGIKVIQAFGAEEHERRAFGRENQRLFRRSLRAVRHRVTSRSLVEGISSVALTALLALGIIVVANRMWGVTPGGLAAFVPVLISTQRAAGALTKSWTRCQDALPSAARFFELLDADAGPADPPDATPLARIERGVCFQNVSFSYGRTPVLRDVSFSIRPGEVIALVGRTGAGKTTIADLLLGFRRPDAGRIEVDGHDLSHIARAAWLEQVAVVTQEPFLFDGSLLENIRYGRPDASEAAFQRAVRAAHVHEFAVNLRDGYETRVGAEGAQLSGGQRQRITIARALLKDPALLIFDEATSALDAESERLVQDAVARLFEGRSVLLIAHRFSTIRYAAQILVLEDGRICQRGSHAELMAQSGLYRELASLQRTAS